MPGKVRVVFYTIDTGGGDPEEDDLLHIGAVSSSGQEFSQYVKPVSPINSYASNKNGLTVTNDWQLLKNGFPVDAECLTRSIVEFIEWLEGLDGGPVYLAGHSFFHRFLSMGLKKARFDRRFQRTVRGLTDTVPLLRARLTPGSSVSLPRLVEGLLGQDPDDLEDALEKAIATKDVVRHLQIPNRDIVDGARWWWDD